MVEDKHRISGVVRADNEPDKRMESGVVRVGLKQEARKAGKDSSDLKVDRRVLAAAFCDCDTCSVCDCRRENAPPHLFLGEYLRMYPGLRSQDCFLASWFLA